MSQSEIWDDAELVDSWNAALEEYKHYHSIHARGEKVEDVLRAHDDQNQNNQPDTVTGGEEGQTPSTNQEEMSRFMEAKRVQVRDNLSASDQTTASVGQRAPSKEPTKPSPPLQLLVGSDAVRDEGLKNLLMSWYYAGYYTGYYEGQQNSRHMDG